MTPQAADPGGLLRLMSGLAARLGLMILIALLPLGMLSVWQTRNVIARAQDSTLEAARGETLQAADAELRLIRSAGLSARVFASLAPEWRNDPEACRRQADRLAALDPLPSVIAFAPLSGLVTCASHGRGADISESPLFLELIERPEPRMIVNAVSYLTGGAVLVISEPVFAEDGSWIGITYVALPHEALATIHAPPGSRGHAERLLGLVTFDGAGTVLAWSEGASAADLPQDHPLALLAGRGMHSFTAGAADARPLIYSVVPVTEDLFVLGIWRDQAATSGVLAWLGPWIYPALMWLAGLVVAVIGAERLVTRHVRRLSQAMTRFAGGARADPDLALDDPPAEIADLADAWRRMSATILRDEAELENLLHEKEGLLREVHHRTGNSLQLIASFLRMHRRETTDEEVRGILDNLHDRVMNLSTVHMGLYRVAGSEDVAMDTLMSEVIGKVSSIHWRSGRRDRMETDLGPLSLPAQQAVPLALLLAEILSCFPPSDIEGEAPPVAIQLSRPEPLRGRLVISGPLAARATLMGERDGAPSIIASRLIRGFVAQLDGTLAVSDPGPERVQATVTFPIRDNTDAPPQDAQSAA